MDVRCEHDPDVGARGDAYGFLYTHGSVQESQSIEKLKVKGELNYIRIDEEGNMRIGAMTTLREIEMSPLVAQNYPVIVHALGRQSKNGQRHRRKMDPFGGVFQGYYVNAVRPDELVTELLIPKSEAGMKGLYTAMEKLGLVSGVKKERFLE
jgi:carbon-monoxide dehydrogenase medium subunit